MRDRKLALIRNVTTAVGLQVRTFLPAGKSESQARVRFKFFRACDDPAVARPLHIAKGANAAMEWLHGYGDCREVVATLILAWQDTGISVSKTPEGIGFRSAISGIKTILGLH